MSNVKCLTVKCLNCCFNIVRHIEIRVDFAIVQDLRFQSPMNLWGTERRSERAQGRGARGALMVLFSLQESGP